MPDGPHASCPIHRHASAQPDALALWAPARRWTFAELDAAVAATGARLRHEGLSGGERVALQLRRGPDLVLLLWALWRTGSVAMPLSTRLPATEAHRVARRHDAQCFVTRDAPDSVGADGPTIYSPGALVEWTGNGTPAPGEQALHRPATLLFTSGSTGRPTAVLHAWANHLYSAKGSNANICLRPGDRWLVSLPLYHVGGLAILVRCALAGTAVAVPDPDASLQDSVGASGATHLSLVATQLRRLLDARSGGASRIRALLLGGGPLPGTLLHRAHDRGWPLHTSYGSTEMASQVTTTAPGAPLDDLRTAGHCLPHRRLRIDEQGQILVAGATLCRSVGDGAQMQDPRVEGWFPTGDLGHLDAQGRLHVQGRTDRQFVSGGENIQPEEIEATFERLDGIERAVVVSVPNEEYGARPVAFLRPGPQALPENWRSMLGTVLPRFKIPDAVYELPDTAVTGQMKIDYERLRRRARHHEQRNESRGPS